MKYQSISDFKHSYTQGGKKYLISPGEVIESATPLSYIFLQQVADDTPVTNKAPYQGNKLQQQVSTLQQEKEAIVSTSQTSIDQIKQQLDSLSAKFDKDMDDITNQINNRFEENEKADLANKQADAKFKDDTNRRLGILKDAVRTIEDEVYGAAEQPPKN